MTAILYMLGGAAIGAGISILLYVLGFGVELINCACQIITCNCEGGDAIPGMWEVSTFKNIFLFCAICGAVIGLVYGIYKMKEVADEEAARKYEENSEIARKQREHRAGDLKKIAMSAERICNKNESNFKPLVSTIYESNDQMQDILNELTMVAEMQGKVKSISKKISEKGDVQK